MKNQRTKHSDVVLIPGLLPIFLHGCELKSGRGLGTRLHVESKLILVPHCQQCSVKQLHNLLQPLRVATSTTTWVISAHGWRLIAPFNNEAATIKRDHNKITTGHRSQVTGHRSQVITNMVRDFTTLAPSLVSQARPTSAREGRVW